MFDMIFGADCSRKIVIIAVVIVIAVIAAKHETRWENEAMMMGSPHAKAVEGYMTELEGQGYRVQKTKWGDEDPNERLTVILEFSARMPGSDEVDLYRWSLKLPGEAIIHGLEYAFEQRPDLCELRPLSRAAGEVHDEVMSRVVFPE